MEVKVLSELRPLPRMEATAELLKQLQEGAQRFVETNA
jgi:hypothetical protein